MSGVCGANPIVDRFCSEDLDAVMEMLWGNGRDFSPRELLLNKVVDDDGTILRAMLVLFLFLHF